MDLLEAAENPKGSALGHVLRMSWPASLTMLNVTIIKFVDGLMVSRVGPGPFAAQFVAGMASFVPESFLVGVLSVVNTYVSQNLGAGKYRKCSLYCWAGIALALSFAALMAPLALPAGRMFHALGHEEWALEAMYFRYMVLSVSLTLTARVLEQFFFGIHRPLVVLTASLIANGCNVLANYTLIFGKFGFPALGLEGAAIGSVASWALQLAILLGVFLSPAIHRRFGSHFVRAVRWRQCRELLRVGWPAGVQLCNDILSWGVGVVVLAGVFGIAHRAATVVAMRYLGISFMPAVGIGIATTALVGRAIGEARRDRARHRAHTALLAAMVYMGACGIAFWLFRYPLVRLFVAEESFVTNMLAQGYSREQIARIAAETVQIGGNIMLCAAFFQLLDAVGIVYVGALRGAGDTLWSMLVTLALSWVFVLGGGAAAVVLLPWLKSIGPWLAASVYVVALGIFMAWRFESGAWRRIDLLGKGRRVVAAGVAEPVAGMPDIVPAPEPRGDAAPGDFPTGEDEPH
jgi:MATE family multidrug resistance protein